MQSPRESKLAISPHGGVDLSSRISTDVRTAAPFKLAVGLSEAAKISDLSRRTLENYIRAKILPARKIGRRTLVLVRDLEQFLRKDHPSPRLESEGGDDAR
jgi:hypothetical protein